MVKMGKGRLYIEGRDQARYLLYLPKDLAEDSMFPFKGAKSMLVKVGFNPKGNKLVVEKWVEKEG